MNRKIYEIENKSSVQFAVVLVNTIPPDLDIDDFALLIGKKWHVGKDKNGIVYVASINQHKQRLQIASKLATTLTNEACTSILYGVKPYFKRSDYNGGLTNLISQISTSLGAAIQAPGSQTATTSATHAANKTNNDTDNAFNLVIGLVFIGLVIMFIIYLLKRGRRNNIPQGYNNMPNNGPMYNNQYPPNIGGGTGSGIGSFVAGAATGALVGYAAERLMDNHNQQGVPDINNGNNGFGNNNIPAEDNPNNYGNWGGGNSSDDNSVDDTGFSSDSDNGATGDW